MLLIVVFTLLAAVAQMSMKAGTNRLGSHPTLLTLITDVPLSAGLALYGVGTVIMVVALKHGELSVLYPLISLNYVWVAIAAVLLFNESMNPAKVAGICVIMAGVAVLGKGAHR